MQQKQVHQLHQNAAAMHQQQQMGAMNPGQAHFHQRRQIADKFFANLQLLPNIPSQYMMNIGKSKDALKLIQVLTNTQFLEAKRNEEPEINVVQPPPTLKETVSTLNSILKEDNNEDQNSKFQGKLDEQQEARKILGKRTKLQAQQSQSKIEEIPALKQLKLAHPGMVTKEQGMEELRAQLLSQIVDGGLMVSSESTLKVFKQMLRSILVNKLTSQSCQILESEQNLVKLLLQMEPGIFSQFATHWLYQTFMVCSSSSMKSGEESKSYTAVSNYILEQFQQNPNLALFNQKTFISYLKFMQTVPVITDSLIKNFEFIIKSFKENKVELFWPILLQTQLNTRFTPAIKEQLQSDLDPGNVGSNANSSKFAHLIKAFFQQPADLLESYLPQDPSMSYADLTEKMLKGYIGDLKKAAHQKCTDPDSLLQVHFFLLTHQADISQFKLFLDRFSPKFDALALKQFKIAETQDSFSQYLKETRLQSPLIKQFHLNKDFQQALVKHCCLRKTYELLISPVNFLQIFKNQSNQSSSDVILTQQAKIGLFSCTVSQVNSAAIGSAQDQPLCSQIDMRMLALSVDDAKAMLELEQVDLVKRQVHLATLLASNTNTTTTTTSSNIGEEKQTIVSNVVSADLPDGLQVLEKLGACRVWMRLCLLLVDKDPQKCLQQIDRLISTKPWEVTSSSTTQNNNNSGSVWQSIKPGLVYWGLKQPDSLPKVGIELTGTAKVPKSIVDELCDTNQKFKDILIKNDEIIKSNQIGTEVAAKIEKDKNEVENQDKEQTQEKKGE